jgi:hypothetical protein
MQSTPLARGLFLSWLQGTIRATEFVDLWEETKGEFMGLILMIVLILLLVGALPTWPYSSGWGYYPSGGLGLIVVILIVLLLMGRLA